MQRIFGLFLLVFIFHLLQAQIIEPQPDATAPWFEGGIELDGRLLEDVWDSSIPADNFWETFPSDTQRAEYQTEIYFGQDAEYFYVGAKMYVQGHNYVIPSLRRDYRAGGNDNITFVFNPFLDKTNAIVFGMNPLGVNREALIYNGGEDGGDFREEWDNRWRGESYIDEDFWSCELRIPWDALRFPEGGTEWFFNSYRFDTQNNTRSTWNHIPQNQMIMSLAYMGRIQFERPVKGSGGFALIPYVGGGFNRDFEADTPSDWFRNVGGDAKIPVSTGLNLDLTVNPDFSQVEVDEQVINTSRFELFFPERRQFFLENADLFSGFGNQQANPFFSRRIGVTRDTTTGEALQNSILYGTRLSGKLDNDWRIGFLNMQAAENFENGLPSYNYTVAAAQRVIGARSNLGGIFVNKQNFGQFRDTSEVNLDFNRVAGLDFNLATSDNIWNGKVYLHRAFGPNLGTDAWSHGLALERRKRRIRIAYNHRYIGRDFDAEVGFVPRRGIFRPNFEIKLSKYPTGSSVVERGPFLDTDAVFSQDEGLTDQSIFIGYSWQYNDTRDLRLFVGREYIFLLDEFDPTRSDAIPLPGRVGYGYTFGGINWSSDRRKLFSTSLQLRGGEFFNGERYSISGNLRYRYQPFGSVDLRFDYTRIDLPEPFASADLFLIGPRIDFTFSKSIFLTTFLQYNSQIDNINLNARLQWRYAPVSDIFLVYTDNYDSMDFGVKSRALVFKCTYWLNI
ncbi:MAG: DUF5916 domain-containing protein [Bacteroidota bacterium]